MPMPWNVGACARAVGRNLAADALSTGRLAQARAAIPVGELLARSARLLASEQNTSPARHIIPTAQAPQLPMLFRRLDSLPAATFFQKTVAAGTPPSNRRRNLRGIHEDISSQAPRTAGRWCTGRNGDLREYPDAIPENTRMADGASGVRHPRVLGDRAVRHPRVPGVAAGSDFDVQLLEKLEHVLTHKFKA